MTDFNFETGIATPEWLTAELVRTGHLINGCVEDVTQTAWSSDIHAASAQFYRLGLTYAPGSTGDMPSNFLLKLTKPGGTPGFEALAALYASQHMTAQSSRHEMMLKEVHYYEALRGDKTNLPHMECYGSALDADTLNTCLLLEDLSGSHDQPAWPFLPSVENCKETVSAFARWQAWWWKSPRFGTEGFPLVTDDLIDEVISTFGQAYGQFETMMGDNLSGRRRSLFIAALKRLPDLMKTRFATSETLTLCHGDAHHYNVLCPKAATRPKRGPVIFDWQTWHIDTPVHDRAYQIAMGWYPECRKLHEADMLQTWLETVQGLGISYSTQDLYDDYRLSIIRHFFSPVVLSNFVIPAVWRPHVERIFSAFDDHECEELLT